MSGDRRWGFHYAMRNEHNVKAIAFLEAILRPIPSWQAVSDSFRDMFRAFRAPETGWELIVNENLFIERGLPGGVLRQLSKAETDRYREPFIEPKSRMPLWRWPNEIPIAGEPADVAAAVADYSAKLQQSVLPKLLLYATPGAVLTEPLVDGQGAP
jgi:haloalkane dehalogenase